MGAVPDKSCTSKDDDNETMPDVVMELATPNYETERGEASDQFVARDAKAGLAVAVAANSATDSQDYQDHDLGNSFENSDRKVFSLLTQANTTHLHSHNRRTVLGQVDANYQSSPRDGPAVTLRLIKLKFLRRTNIISSSGTAIRDGLLTR